MAECWGVTFPLGPPKKRRLVPLAVSHWCRFRMAGVIILTPNGIDDQGTGAAKYITVVGVLGDGTYQFRPPNGLDIFDLTLIGGGGGGACGGGGSGGMSYPLPMPNGNGGTYNNHTENPSAKASVPYHSPSGVISAYGAIFDLVVGKGGGVGSPGDGGDGGGNPDSGTSGDGGYYGGNTTCENGTLPTQLISSGAQGGLNGINGNSLSGTSTGSAGPSGLVGSPGDWGSGAGGVGGSSESGNGGTGNNATSEGQPAGAGGGSGGCGGGGDSGVSGDDGGDGGYGTKGGDGIIRIEWDMSDDLPPVHLTWC